MRRHRRTCLYVRKREYTLVKRQLSYEELDPNSSLIMFTVKCQGMELSMQPHCPSKGGGEGKKEGQRTPLPNPECSYTARDQEREATQILSEAIYSLYKILSLVCGQVISPAQNELEGVARLSPIFLSCLCFCLLEVLSQGP